MLRQRRRSGNPAHDEGGGEGPAEPRPRRRRGDARTPRARRAHLSWAAWVLALAAVPSLLSVPIIAAPSLGGQHPMAVEAPTRATAELLGVDVAASSPRATPSGVPRPLQPILHLSHSGLYLNAPLSADPAADDATTEGTAPPKTPPSPRPPPPPPPPTRRRGAPQLELRLDPHGLAVDLYSLALRISLPRARDWEEVTRRCGDEAGGIEACEADDLRWHDEVTAAAAGGTAEEEEGGEQQRRWRRRGPESVDDGEPPGGAYVSVTCAASSVVADRAIFHPRDCLPLRLLWASEGVPSTSSPRGVGRSREDEGVLRSVVVSVAGLELDPSPRWWIGQLEAPRALWPVPGATRAATRDGWNGTVVDRIAGAMENPYLARSGEPDKNDPLRGLDLSFNNWNLGVSIRVPPPGPHEDPDWLPIHSPASGQVVWVGHYERERAPADGRNNQRGNCVMIRDEWGFVYQLFGMAKPTITVSPGQLVFAGQVVGRAIRRPLSPEPPSQEPPADPSPGGGGGAPDGRRYPFWFREVRVGVARPDPSWESWRPPYDPGWTYFNPLLALHEGEGQGARTSIPPDPSPPVLYFARPPRHAEAAEEPEVFATSADVFRPRLSGEVEVIASFDAFLATAGNPADRMDAQAVYAMEWAAWKEEGSGGLTGAGSGGMCDLPPGVAWRGSFDFSKIGWQTAAEAETSVLRHIVPSFTTSGFLSRTVHASQWDEKVRRAYYAPTRASLDAWLPSAGGERVASGGVGGGATPPGRERGRGRRDVGSRGAKEAGERGGARWGGAWDTSLEPGGAGVYLVRVRARGYLGETGCVTARVNLS